MTIAQKKKFEAYQQAENTIDVYMVIGKLEGRPFERLIEQAGSVIAIALGVMKMSFEQFESLYRDFIPQPLLCN